MLMKGHMRSPRLRGFPSVQWGRACHAAGLHCRAALDLREDIANKRQSAEEITQACLDRIRVREEALGSFLTIDEDGALAQVRLVLTEANAWRRCAPLDSRFEVRSSE